MLAVANALHWIAKTYRSPGVRLKGIRTVADSGGAIQATIISLAVACDDVTGFAAG
jgi:molybdopterin-biosynthesis enzyme MoeA-like protein